jgi:hypothetical protein
MGPIGEMTARGVPAWESYCRYGCAYPLVVLVVLVDGRWMGDRLKVDLVVWLFFYVIFTGNVIFGEMEQDFA